MDLNPTTSTTTPAPEPQPEASSEAVVTEVLSEREASAEEMLPIPAGPVRQGKPSLWKRISMRRRAEGGANGLASSDEINGRLALVESRLEILQESINTRFRQLDQRLEDVWEPEEQLSHLMDIQEKLDNLARHQADYLEATRKARRLTIVMGVLTLASVGLLAAAQFSKFIPLN